MFSTPETSVHVQHKNGEISPLERGRLRGKGSGEKVSFKTRIEDPVRSCIFCLTIFSLLSLPKDFLHGLYCRLHHLCLYLYLYLFTVKYHYSTEL